MKYRVQVFKEVKYDNVFIVDANNEEEAKTTAIFHMQETDEPIEWEPTYEAQII